MPHYQKKSYFGENNEQLTQKWHLKELDNRLNSQVNCENKMGSILQTLKMKRNNNSNLVMCLLSSYRVTFH